MPNKHRESTHDLAVDLMGMLDCNIVIFNHQRNFIFKKGWIYVSKQLGFELKAHH
jgi:hypothetical protein